MSGAKLPQVSFDARADHYLGVSSVCQTLSFVSNQTRWHEPILQHDRSPVASRGERTMPGHATPGTI
jgi:hypothetical protein